MQLWFVVRRQCKAHAHSSLILFCCILWKFMMISLVETWREKHLSWCFPKPSDVSAVVSVLLIRILEQWDRTGCEWITKYTVMPSIHCLTMEILCLCEGRELWNFPPLQPRGANRSLVCGWYSSWSGMISSKYRSPLFIEVVVNNWWKGDW